MNVILDTNVFMVSLASHSKYHLIYQSLLNNVYNLYVSNEIITEYEEVISERLGHEATDLKLKELLNLRNVHKIEPFYNWQLIEVDPDDNKFADCAIAIDADFLVSNDGHFKVLKDIPFPSVNVIKAEDFLLVLERII
jgi:uncharacterized protein